MPITGKLIFPGKPRLESGCGLILNPDISNQSWSVPYSVAYSVELTDKGTKPDDIPTAPERVYKDKGWKGYGDWLGTGAIASHKMIYRSFQEARFFVHSLKLNSRREWIKYTKGALPHLPPKPDDIPVKPDNTYKDKGWKGIGDWLGTGTVRPQDKTYRSFKDARSFVLGLKLKSQKEWIQYKKGALPHLPPKPDDIPAMPEGTYKDKGWKGYGDWLGTGAIASHKMIYRSFKEARSFVHSLKLKSQKEWIQYTKGALPHLPPKPQRLATRWLANLPGRDSHPLDYTTLPGRTKNINLLQFQDGN